MKTLIKVGLTTLLLVGAIYFTSTAQPVETHAADPGGGIKP